MNRNYDKNKADLRAELQLLREQAAVQAISPDGVESKAGKNYSDAQLYLDIAGVMFVVISDTQKVTLINRKGCEILGYQESEIIGQDWFENFLPERIRHQAAEVFHRLMNGDIEPVEYFENPVLIRNGEERLIAWHNTVIRNKQGLPLATLSSGTDVTEQKRAQAELERYKAHLEELVEKRTAQLKTTNKRLEKEISERKRTEQAFLESQVRFAGILDTATEAVISIDQDQRIMLFNKGAENTFGYRADEAIGRSLNILLPEVRDDAHRQFIADVAASPETTHFIGNRHEIFCRRNNGELFAVSASISKLTVGDKQIVTVVLHDITERIRMEEEREQRILDLKALNESVRSITAELSLEQVLQKIARAAQELVQVKYTALGLHDGEGRLSRFITVGIDQAEHSKIGPLPVGRGLLGHLLHRGVSIVVEDIANHPMSAGFPENHPRMDNLLGVPVFSKGRLIGALYLTDKLDGTGFTEADRQLVEMLSVHAAIAIENAQLYEQTQRLVVLEERERFARDLHDGIIQSIYGVGLALDQAKMDIRPTNYSAREQIELSLKSLASVIKDIRNYIFDLRPEALKYQGLKARLLGLIRELRVNTLLPIQAEISPDIDSHLSEIQARHIFHITHEALSNAARHAKANRIRLNITRDREKITVIVEDDGIGFNYHPEMAPGHHGLRNIQSRAAQLDANFSIDTAPGNGTRLRLVLNYNPKV